MKAALPRDPKGKLLRADAAVPAGRRVYAIGDVHGRADLLGRMADAIAADLGQTAGLQAVTVCVGDYIDRGPESAAVIERLAGGDFPTPLVTLRGNHEDIFLGFLAGAVSPAQFFDNGGDTTLRSYGLQPDDVLRLEGRALQAVLETALPVHHERFVRETGFSHVEGDYFFCHAGARPGVALERQSPDDLVWIREDFLTSTFDFGKVVVHGHTPVKVPQVRVNGIDIDTKAFASGILTALVLEGTDLRFIQAKAD